MKKLFLFCFIGAPLLAVAMLGVRAYYSFNMWTYPGPPVVFEVKSGESFSRINGRLANRGIISSPKLFHRYCQFKDLLTKFKVGQYEIKPGQNMGDIIEVLTKGKSISTAITIPEGKNLFEIAEILESKKICPKKDFILSAKKSSLAKELGIKAERLEGYLYPDTYDFPKGMKSDDVVRSMVRNFKRKTKEVDFSNAPNDLNRHQTIIMASIVEKETGAKHERPIIAGVYHNRLTRKMRLYSDPTTIYGIWETWNGNLRKRHLKGKTAYNTYKMDGLPFGPIANPGLASIKAALNPSKHNYTYFVSKNDGTHIFTENYKDHLKAVDYWQKNVKNRAGKSWRQLDEKKK